MLSKLARIILPIYYFYYFRRNPAIPDSDETVRIPAFISNSGYISQNQVKIVKILSLSDRISSSMIFILFYIYIFMLWIKIDFYKLICLNKNIKKYLRFSVRAKHRKMLSTENDFLKNDFPKTILWWKPFYVETNGALTFSIWGKRRQIYFYVHRSVHAVDSHQTVPLTYKCF